MSIRLADVWRARHQIPMASRVVRVVRWVLTRILYTCWVALMIATPLFGFWLASSLAAYDNATQWLSLGVGLLLFPILPFGWDALFVWRRNRQKDPRPPILTRLDRLVLRTLIINGAFFGVMMWHAPHTAFRALAVRGDWFLDGHDGPIANRVRDSLLGFADHFESRWHESNDTFGTSDTPPEPTPHHDDIPPQPTLTPTPIVEPQKPVTEPVKPARPIDPHGWPRPTQAAPAVLEMPAEVQSSPASVGRYLAAQITDPHELAKAVHDYVVLRLHYDDATAALSDAESETKRPSQRAVAVFAAKTGVCEGYARLFVAIGKAAGLEVAYITGYIRDAERHVDALGTDKAITHLLEGYLHAWNAVKIDGSWLLVDATWDDPTGGTDALSTTYLFTPPPLFALDHLPEQPRWQLVDKPLTAGDFARQPLLGPYIGELGVTLESPSRSQITVDDDVEVVVANPFGATLLAEVKGLTGACTEQFTSAAHPTMRCSVPAGQQEIQLYGTPESGEHHVNYFGSVLVNRR